MTDTKCYFHPQDEAVKKCETCGKLLCKECNEKHWHVCGMPEPPFN